MRGIKRLVGACFLVGGLVFGAGAASAQGIWPGGPGATTPLVPGQFFIGVGGQVQWYHLPKFNSPWRTADENGNDLFRPSFDPDPTVYGPGGTFGYVFQNGTFPEWVGQNVRVSVSGQTWNGLFSMRADRVNPSDPASYDGYASAAPIDGSLGTNDRFNYMRLRLAGLKVRATGFELALRLTGDHKVRDNVLLSPFVALIGGHSREHYMLRARLHDAIVAGYDDNHVYSLDEWLSSNRIGMMLGTGVTVRVHRRVLLHVAGQVGLVFVWSHMNGRDCFSGDEGAPTAVVGQSCYNSPANNGSFQTSVTDNRSQVGFRGGINGGVSLNLDFAIVTISGFMSYDTAVPGVRNPVVTTAITNTGNNNQPTSGPARIFFDDAINYGAMLIVRIPLNSPGA